MKKLRIYKGGQWQEVVGAPADLTGVATEQFVTNAIAAAATGSVDLSAYAKLNDTAQAITAKSATAETFTGVAFQFIKGNAPSTAFALADVDGQERPVYAVGSKKFPLAFTTETTGSGSVDLSAYAKTEDKEQYLLAKTVTAKGFGFGEAILPTAALTYTDTGAGYGQRLVLAVGENIEYIPYQSDFEPLRARIESLENKQAPVAEAVDLTPYALKSDLLGLATETSVAATYLTKSDARIYTTAADVAAAVSATYATKATTYTKTECDTKFLTLVDVNGVYAPAADTYTKAEVETRLLEVPAPVKYLHWGGVFQKLLGASAKDKWTAAGLLPSIQIVKGKHYRLEMTVKFGPLNTDVKEAWVGFRFNYKTINELPCTKQPLVTMSGWGTSTVTRARGAIAATAVATTTPTRADRFRFNCVDDWTSAEDIIEYAVEFEADQDIANANFVPEICFGGTWLNFPTNFEGVVAVLRQMD